MGVCTWVLCFALLQLSMKAYKKRHAELENPKEDDDETNKRELTVFAVCAHAAAVSDDAALYICLQNGQDTSILPTPRCSTRRRVSCWPSAGAAARYAQAVLQPAHRVRRADAGYEVLSVAMPQTGWLDHCQRCHILPRCWPDTAADREKSERREAYGFAPARQILTALAICVLPRRQDRHGVPPRWQCRAGIPGPTTWPIGAAPHHGSWRWR